MRHLIWHWGRRGAGPLFAARLTEAFNTLENQAAFMSLPDSAEILTTSEVLPCDWREPTYESGLGYVKRRLVNAASLERADRHLTELAPDMAICAMPSLLDKDMAEALMTRGIPYAVIVHDAEAHPGEALRFAFLGQERLLHGAQHLFCLSGHVEDGLRRNGFGQAPQTLTRLWHPHQGFDTIAPAARASSKPKLLHFGRLRAYKGLDLLANALKLLGPDLPFELRVCGEGPASVALARMRAMKDVAVEARWFAEPELPGLLSWADALVLPYREASQSGVASMGLAAGRHVLATSVGGLPEQLAGAKGAVLCAPTAPAIAQAILDLTDTLRSQDWTALELPDWRQSWNDMAAIMVNTMWGWNVKPRQIASQRAGQTA